MVSLAEIVKERKPKKKVVSEKACSIQQNRKRSREEEEEGEIQVGNRKVKRTEAEPKPVFSVVRREQATRHRYSLRAVRRKPNRLIEH